ncbi:sigma-54-dependent transcriptional regulator [Desulforhabdus amnigena]|jgi:DNA-binding NtrC family response regulator|uniref:Sigma-54-dependent Fis family transcriptional regulator n=1 Tax=Desulforhabdus amnigena TaxID=40218 RepID=A0A9W6FST9_9BACT|nr:sigma-54 dependent transcriptional regulator [Desulforhabdus amnigena]GLI34428.1 sigma-54-dependent Fis family transcriptional regulator [Desulforhabdus amnigena]
MQVRIAIVDDEIIVCRRLSQALSKDGHEVEAFTTGRSFLESMSQNPFDVVFSDLRLPDLDGMEVLSRTKAIKNETEVIIITGYGSIDGAIQAIKEGAYYYTTKPLKLNEVRALAKGAIEKISMREENQRLREALKGGESLNAIIGTSLPIQNLFSMIHKVAPVDCNILLLGASGTGKALVARAIHQLSPRNASPFVSFNCGGFTEELISSELFGYEKGAFTGATASKVGLLESGSGGTVFLDEVGEMPFSMQVRLLHVIQEKRILRVGGTRPIDLNLRIIAATNRDLKHEVALGNFREDLFFRLNVVTIHLPQLNERKEDIPLLVKHFLKKYSLAFRKSVVDIQSQALQILMNYSYPGNVRELENIIERAVALTDSDHIRPQDLPQDLQQLEFDTIEGEGLQSLDEIERRYIAKVLEKTGYNKSLTAQILNIPRTTLWRKMKEYKLQ